MKPIDLLGQSFGRLTVVKRNPNSPAGKARWLCSCQCGGQVEVLGASLLNGRSKSCGCLKDERTAEMGRENSQRLVRHGMSKTPAHVRWRSLKDRCFNPRNKHYKDYGARGITVCERWLVFENFYADMGEAPEGKSIDRINNDGDYEPGNCRWATPQEQIDNRRNK